jgi:hypothetical protein
VVLGLLVMTAAACGQSTSTPGAVDIDRSSIDGHINTVAASGSVLYALSSDERASTEVELTGLDGSVRACH